MTDPEEHEHSWSPNMVTVTVPEEGHFEKQVIKEAWTEYVEHEEIGHYGEVLVSEAWDEEKPDMRNRSEMYVKCVVRILLEMNQLTQKRMHLQVKAVVGTRTGSLYRSERKRSIMMLYMKRSGSLTRKHGQKRSSILQSTRMYG